MSEKTPAFNKKKLSSFNSIRAIILFIITAAAVIAFTLPPAFINGAVAGEENPASGASVSSQDKDDFMKAVKKGDFDEVKKLVEKGIDVNAKFVLISMKNSGANDYTALMSAASEGHTEVLNYLLEKGADAGAIDSKNRGAWDYAEAYGHKKILEILKAKGFGPSQHTKGAVEEMQLNKCKNEMDKILLALELCDMEGALTPTITINELIKGKYIKDHSRCPQNTGEDYMITIQGQKNSLKYDVKCKIHGSLKELSARGKK